MNPIRNLLVSAPLLSVFATLGALLSAQSRSGSGKRYAAIPPDAYSVFAEVRAKPGNRPLPGIVVTVDMLSTGVDIPDLEFIVFLRPVKSRILFEQMLGRGTRKGEKFPDKSHFVVFDCFDGTLIAYFKRSTSITAEPPDPPTRSIKEIVEAIWQNKDRDYNTRCLVKRLQRVDKEMSGNARTRVRVVHS